MSQEEKTVTSSQAIDATTGENKGTTRSVTIRDVSDTDEFDGVPLTGWRLTLVTFSLCLGTFLVALDINIIGVAVPRITSVFNSLEDASWYATAYLLPVTALQPTMAYLYKGFNVRVIYLANVCLFEAGSVLCAAAPNSLAFILGRALAGVGAAALLQGALAIITLIVELDRRPLFMGIVISVFGVAVCIGPVVGGVLVDKATWRWCFWINLPIGAVAVVTLVFFLRLRNIRSELSHLTTAQKVMRMDFVGTMFFLGAVVCMILGLTWGGQTMPWSSATIIGLFITFGILVTLFIGVQWWKKDDALIPPRVLRQRSILVGSLFLFFFGMFIYTYSFYLPFYFQAAQGVSPITSGVRIIPFMLATIVFVGLTGAVVTQWGHYVPYMIFGSIIAVIGSGLITRLDINTPTAVWASFLVIAGAGQGIAQQMPYSAVQVMLSEADIPIGNALFTFFNQLGGIIALPISQSLWLSSLRSQIQIANSSPGVNVNVDANTVIAIGASNLTSLPGLSEDGLSALRSAYATSLRRPFIVALAAACVAVVLSPWMDWRNIKREAVARREREGRGRMGNVKGVGVGAVGGEMRC